MSKLYSYILISLCLMLQAYPAFGEDETPSVPTAASIVNETILPTAEELANLIIFDDNMYLAGYARKYRNLPKSIILEMIKDETLAPYKTAAAVRVFNEEYSHEVVSREKKLIEKAFLRRLNRAESPFVQVELMYALLKLDRYRYFKSIVPGLTQKLNHYNAAVNELAYNNLNAITQTGSARAREARIIFNTLRKMLFLERKYLAEIEEAQPPLTYKLKLLRWSIKILGTQELKRLPKESIHLL